MFPRPFWTTYPEAIRLAGGVPVEVFAGPEQGYLVTVEQLEAAVTERDQDPAVRLAVQPHRRRVLAGAGRAKSASGPPSKGLWVVTDEIYEHLTYDGVPFTSIATAVPELGDKVVILNGVAKTYAMTGWRVGWMIGPADVIKAATNLQSHATSNVSNIIADRCPRRRLRPADRRRRNEGGLRPPPQGDRRRPERDRRRGMPDAEGRLLRLRGRPRAAGQGIPDGERSPSAPSTSAELAALILDEVEVAVVPGEAFGPSGYLRLSYALGDEDLATGVARLQDFLGKAK